MITKSYWLIMSASVLAMSVVSFLLFVPFQDAAAAALDGEIISISPMPNAPGSSDDVARRPGPFC